MTATSATTPIQVPSPPTPAREPGTPVARRFPRPVVAGLVSLVLLGAGSATWMLASRSSEPPIQAPVETVQDGRWGGPDVFEPPARLGAPLGSADSLERQAG